MIVEVKVPEIGESITEGVLVAWLRQDGDLVQGGESIFELETDKVTMAVPADVPGRLSTVVSEGETVKVGQVVAKIDTDASDQLQKQPSPQMDASSPQQQQSARPSSPVLLGDGPSITPPAGIEQALHKTIEGEGQPLSPAVRRLVAEHSLDPNKIPGTGKEGRILKGDVIGHLEKTRDKEPTPMQMVPVPRPVVPNIEKAVQVAPVTAVAKVPVEDDRETRVKMTPLRHRISERMVMAQQNAAILTTFNEVDMSAVMAFRSRHKDKFQAKFDVRLGFMSFFVKAAVDALKTVPQVNAKIDGDDIVYHHYHDIGVAVNTEQGLIVPVIRDADRLSFAQIEARIVDYATRASARKLTLNELTGGCFTISNGGVYGSLLSTPILNPPQSGILGMHGIKKRPVVINDEIVVRPMMYLALSYDHRLVDGSQAVTFLKRIVECVEEPERMLLGV